MKNEIKMIEKQKLKSRANSYAKYVKEINMSKKFIENDSDQKHKMPVIQSQRNLNQLDQSKSLNEGLPPLTRNKNNLNSHASQAQILNRKNSLG